MINRGREKGEIKRLPLIFLLLSRLINEFSALIVKEVLWKNVYNSLKHSFGGSSNCFYSTPMVALFLLMANIRSYTSTVSTKYYLVTSI